MKLTLVTPLFPPDTGDPAPYVKELATRLQPTHEVTVLLYGFLPESVPGATLLAVDKRHGLLRRIWRFTVRLFAVRTQTDYFLVQNGPSVELPTALLLLFSNARVIFIIADDYGIQLQQCSWWRRWLHHVVQHRAQRVIDLTRNDQMSRLTRPDVLPFDTEHNSSLPAYEIAWRDHLQTITTSLS